MKNTPMGVLPQGAPSSPMLANLAARGLDESLSSFARDRGLVYTRYADDLTFSSIRDSVGEDMRNIRRNITSLIRRSRFKVNVEKTRVARPGAKKLVLGLLVDGDNPRSSREMRHRVDRLLHAVVKYGLGPTAAHEKFESAIGLYNHLSGLMSFFKDVDRPMWQRYQLAYEQIPPPLNA
jgi:RNA-directed DNA polymerase